MNNEFTRRSLLQGATIAATASLGASKLSAAARTTMSGVAFEKRDTVRAAVIGVGARGSEHVRLLAAIDHVEITAVCDVVPEKVKAAQKRVRDAGKTEPAAYFNGDHDYETLLRRDDVDIAIIATPWDWHVPMALYAMRHDKTACVEVPAAGTIADCWKLVETSEETRRHCIMLENCCYGRNEMMVRNMVRAGLFGTLTHGEAAYLHDLRGVLTEDKSEGLWRRFPHTLRNGNLYPTHGLGPVALYMDVNRGDRFDSIVSVSSREASLTEYVHKTFPNTPKAREQYICGDMNTSIIKTVKGLTILLQHNVVSPRPYDRLNMISGSAGVFRDYPARIYLDGHGKEAWHELDEYKEKYDDPLWKTQGEMAEKQGGHDGMDYVMTWRLVQCIREGLPPDLDVYDAAAWSAPGPLSESSVAAGGAPQRFPDFMHGER